MQVQSGAPGKADSYTTESTWRLREHDTNSPNGTYDRAHIHS